MGRLACVAAEKAGYVHVRPPVVLSGYAVSCGRTLAIRTVTWPRRVYFWICVLVRECSCVWASERAREKGNGEGGMREGKRQCRVGGREGGRRR